MARGATGATTVSATMLLAAAAGVRVFVTGGIGGVHRGGEATWDVSADLSELGRTPVAVVCAGAKSILDIPRTLEVLETQGVAVRLKSLFVSPPSCYQLMALCRSRRLLRWARTSSRPSTHGPAACARRGAWKRRPRLRQSLQRAHAWGWRAASSACLSQQSMLLRGPPWRRQRSARPARRLQCRAWMLTRVRRRTALAEAAAANVGGAAVTPFILRRVSELTGGASLKANIALIKHNARVGAQIAVALAPLLAADAKRD